jgi:hypothetical protein
VETAAAIPVALFRPIRAVKPGRDASWCLHSGERATRVPAFLGAYLRPGDGLAEFGLTEFLIACQGDTRRSLLLHAAIGYAAQPKRSKNGEWLVRAEVPGATASPRALLIAGDAIRRYFYLPDRSASLYDILGCPPDADPATLRMAWRVRNVELAGNDRECARAERAFNVLAHPELRHCCDAMRVDDDAAPLFPYGGFGSILVEGKLADDVFFVHRILAYRPEMRQRRFSLLLRQCEFLADRVVCRDPRRHIDVSLDANLLPDLHWDLTWNQWRHWLKSRIEVDSAFAYSGRYQLQNGEWVLRRWLSAIPSRIKVRLPEGLAADVAKARAIHQLLGENAEVVQRVRTLIEQQPAEHTQVQKWFDELSVSTHLRPQHVNWQPDYDAYYFDQLRRNATTWFLFRREFLFVMPHVLVSEVPESGHATYIFAKPTNLDAFLARYATSTREDIRHNRANRGGDLGFVGRVVRGNRKKRWLANVLKFAGERADYVPALD